MESAIIQELVKLGGMGLILFFMLKYFMEEVRRKDEQNQGNLNKFIELQIESNKVHAQTALTLASATTQIADMYSIIRQGDICKARQK